MIIRVKRAKRFALAMMHKRPDIKIFIRKLIPPSIKTKSGLAWGASFLVCLIIILINLNSSRSHRGTPDEFEVGKVAERDVVAEQTIYYEDENATRLRIEAQERLIPAVFHYSLETTEELRNRWHHFAALAASNSMEELSHDAYRFSLQSEFPGYFPDDDVLDILYHTDDRQLILGSGTAVLYAILGRGIYSMPETGLENLNPDAVELIRITGTRVERERVPLGDITIQSEIAEAVSIHIFSGSYPPLFAQLASRLLRPFLLPNVFYSPEDTTRRIAEVRANTDPVMRTIEQGKRIIKRGFIITEEEIDELHALRVSLPGNDLPIIIADIIFLFLLFCFLFYFCDNRIIGRSLTDREAYLLAGLSALYIAGSVLTRNLSIETIPASVVFPTALLVMLPAILIHPRLALVMALALPLGSFLTESFDTPSFIFALVSGVVAAYSLQRAEKRMDLIKAGLTIAAANIASMIAILLWQRNPAGAYPPALFWAAFNGIASGMLVLGALSPLEQALNAATAFRLIELSDLNVPILRRLFSVAPGTYSHSIMVANLAEAACQDIRANPLLARVGAYYHDLGKMENPDYFVENQTSYNRHDDMAPRLSATVVRSHVKLGVEKARQLGLPQDVIDIISEHHGNSVITWFYSKALKQEGPDPKKGIVDIEDFSYPGNPPRSRESAVVMLADVAEAAVRTLEKPNAVKIEKFIQELIAKKVEHGQLARSELTFRDLEIIKNAFVRVLAGHYHSRIEYPKIDAPNDAKDSSDPNAGDAEKQAE
jgi:putative nucleotidyltransferase with HDIG domain